MSDAVLLRAARIFDGNRIQDERGDVLIRDGRITVVAAAGTIDVPARTIERPAVLPGIVDAHVHVTLSTSHAIVAAGVTGALDLGAPATEAFTAHPPLRLRAAGPLLTAPGGYPTTTWGANGYGFEIASGAQATEAVAMLADRGAAVIKVAITEPPALDAASLGAIVRAARSRGLSVAAHALTAAAVRAALDAEIDVLAHTPVETLDDPIVNALGRRGVTVISTVRAFGAARPARENLAALAAAGCPVAYGSDLGNEGIEPGVDPAELSILDGALGGAEAALRAATSTAAAVAGFPPAGIRTGETANLIVCDGLDFAMLRRPLLTMIDGKEIPLP